MTNIRLWIVLLTVEKLLQHLVTAVFFAVSIPGIGTPDIGPNFAIGNGTMAFLNVLYTCGFGLSLYGWQRARAWGLPLIVGLAALDIVLEFMFHGWFYITVSVIVSTALILLAWRFRKLNVRR